MKLFYAGIVFITATYALSLVLGQFNAHLLFDMSGVIGIAPIWREIAAYILAGP